MSKLKEKLMNNEHLVGMMLNLMTKPDFVQIFKSAGLDFFIIDWEHGFASADETAALVALAKALEVGVFVRIPEVNRTDILHLMEMGVDGLMLPNANTPEQVKAFVEHAKYAPLGNRGLSFMRGHNRYVPVPDQVAYMAQSNEETILIIQVESTQSLENINQIMATPGIDIAFIGPTDLCHSLGIPGGKSDPLYHNALQAVIQACRENGKHCGTQGMTPTELDSWFEKGMTFNIFSTDVNIFYNALKRALGEIKR